MWDERFLTPGNKEADYYIRALIHNKEHSMIGDKVHKRTLNIHDYLPLDTSEYQGGNSDWLEIKSNELWDEAWYHTTQIFYWKWKDTWKGQPSYNGWLVNWTQEFIDNPPEPLRFLVLCNTMSLRKPSN